MFLSLSPFVLFVCHLAVSFLFFILFLRFGFFLLVLAWCVNKREEVTSPEERNRCVWLFDVVVLFFMFLLRDGLFALCNAKGRLV